MFRRTREVIARTKEDYKEQKAAENAEFAGFNPPEFKIKASVEAEFASIEAFVEEKMDNEESTYNVDELDKLRASGACRGLTENPIKVLASYGLSLEHRAKVREVRGYTAFSSLYAGNPCAGGSGVDPHGGGSRFKGS